MPFRGRRQGLPDFIPYLTTAIRKSFDQFANILLFNLLTSFCFSCLQEYEDLDEIIARHIQPMAAYVRDIMGFKYYRTSDGGKREILDKLLMEEKKKAPSRYRIHFHSRAGIAHLVDSVT